MRTGSLTCEGCAGDVVIPQDPTLLAATCAYCGRQLLLPDQDQRRAALERAREREREAQEKATAASSERTSRRRFVLLWTAAALVFGGVMVVSILKSLGDTGSASSNRGLVASSAGDAEVDRLGAAASERLRGLVTTAQIGTCGRIFAEPQLGDKTVDLRFTVGTHQCARFLATAAAVDGVVKLTVTDPSGATAARARPGRDVDYLYCPRTLTGTHAAAFTSAGPVAAVGIECERKMPTDPTGVGATRVASLLAAREAAGCRQILSAARTHPSEATLTARLERGACVQVIAATGMKDNLLTASMMTPEGRPVPAPPPALAVVLSHCASRAGEHSGRISAALDGPFTTAAIICPRRAMPRPPPAGGRMR
jgi:uncharacterized membrane protein